MGKSTDTFFNKKREWSIAKDDLLRCYLRPYMSKIFHTRKMNVYIDCFAGAGKFGKEQIEHINVSNENIPLSFGSPLIALKEIQCSYNDSKAQNPRYIAYFIEKKYFNLLRNNIEHSQFSRLNYRVLDGSYQDQVPVILNELTSCYQKPNLLCYLDPYGVKDLKMEYLKRIMGYELNNIEFLINFNSFGFFRYACGASKIAIRELDLKNPGELIEQDPLLKSEWINDRLSIFYEILGTNAWKRVINLYRRDEIDGYKAERIISGLYRKQLKRRLGFKYVLSIPIRLNESVHPKYRMVYATNHEHGAALMGQVMLKRQKYLYDQFSISKTGGLSLFDIEDLNQKRTLKECILECLEGEDEIGGTSFIAKFYDQHYLTSQLGETLKLLEKEKKITIRRDPETTIHGKPSKFMTESRSKRLYIKLNK